MNLEEPVFEDVLRAAVRLRRFAHRTPIFTSDTLDDRTSALVSLKAENLQKVGAFKFRGATNAVQSLSDDEARRGVLTHSSGNHGAALALAARHRGIPAYVVMPENSARVKIDAVAGYGAEITYCRPTTEDRQATANRVMDETGAAMIHPYDDPRVVAGQGTAALELLENVPNLDLLLLPVGGGGLAAGCALAVRGFAPKCRVVGVEPAAADDTYRSLQTGERQGIVGTPDTLADGLRASVGELTLPMLQRLLADVVTVSEDAIVHAMRWIWERMKLVVEPSAAVPLAAVFEGKVSVAGQRVGILLSGGNVDLDRLPWRNTPSSGSGSRASRSS